MNPIPHTSCPQCGELHSVTNKLLATNRYKGEAYVKAFEVIDPHKFELSPFTRDDCFVNALFCRACEIAFIPDDIAADMGIGRNTGAYVHAVDSKSSVRRFNAMIWRADDASGVRVEVSARSPEEAKQLLESEHGVGTVFYLHNEEDASRLR